MHHPSNIPTGGASKPYGVVGGAPQQFAPGANAAHAYSMAAGQHPLSASATQQQQQATVTQQVTAAPPARQSERFLLSTASAMAQKSYNEGNYAMAKRLLDSISLSYRHEGWKSILTTILLTSLDCAMRLHATHDAVLYTLELMGGNLLVTTAQKQMLMSQLMTIASGPPQAPLPAVADSTVPVPFDVAAHVFEVDRRHGILSATSHFLTVPSSAQPALPSDAHAAATGVVVPVSSARDPFVCVQEEFDLVLTLAVAFPIATEFARLDVYFYAPPPIGLEKGSSTTAPVTTPYHLVLLPGGAEQPDGVVERRLSGSSSSASVVSDRDLPVLRPDSAGSVRADLSFPGVIGSINTGVKGLAGVAASGSNAGAAVTAAGHASVFTFGPPQSASASSAHAAPAASRTFRVRMKATQATTTNSATLNLPLAPANTGAAPSGPNAAAVSGAASGVHIPGANQALFVTTVVAALAIPPTNPTDAPRALQLKLDVLPSKHEESFVPSVVAERLDAARKEKEKKALKKGLTLAPLQDVSVDPSIPARTPTLRILPQHARAHLGLLHPNPALIGEYYPLQVRVGSDGDEIKGGELTLFSTVPSATTVPGTSPSSSPMPAGGLSTSGSLENLSGNKADDALPGELSTVTLARSNSTTDPAATPESVRFYRLAAAGNGLVGRPSAGVTPDSLFEEIPAGAAVPVPTLAAGGAHTFTLFLRALTPVQPTLSLTLSYTNAQGTPLSVTSVLNSLAFRAPFKIKSKIFSDALSGLSPAAAPVVSGAAGAAAAVTPAQPQRLILHQPVLLHVELENVSGAVLRLDELALELSNRFFKNTSRLVHGAATQSAPAATPSLADHHVQLRPCVTPAAAIALSEAAKLQSPPLAASSLADAAVCLAPGEKYTHLFSFVPVVAGKTRFTPLHVRWNRVGLTKQHPPLPAITAAAVMSISENDDGDEDDDQARSAAAAAAAKAIVAPKSPPPALIFPTPPVQFRKDLVYFHILKVPLSVTVDAPASATFGDVVEYRVRIKNSTDQLHDVEVCVLEPEGTAAAGTQGATTRGTSLSAAAGTAHTASHAGHASLIKCVLSGKTRGLLRIRPHSTCLLVYKLCPLECGALQLPRIQLKAAGLTTLNTQAQQAGGGGPAAAAAPPAAAQQSILLMDPNDAGVIFVHPRAKKIEEAEHATAAPIALKV